MAYTKKIAAVAAAVTTLFAGAAVFTLNAAQAQPEPAKVDPLADAQVLRVGSLTAYPPFESVNAQTGEYVGFDMDLIQEMGRRMNRKIEIVSMSLDAIVPALLTGNVELGISAFTITPERSAKVNFSEPYYDAGLTIMTTKDNAPKIKSVKDLEGKCLCAEIGSSGALYSKNIPGVTIRHYNSAAEAFLELNQNGCYAMLNDRPVNEYFLAQKRSTTLNLTELPMVLSEDKYGIAVPKDKPELLQQVNATLQAMRDDGTYDKIYAKWFGKRN